MGWVRLPSATAALPPRCHTPLLLLYLTLLQSLCLYCFTYGFFLTRYQLLDTSTCAPLPHPSAIASGIADSRFAFSAASAVSAAPPFLGSRAGLGCWYPASHRHAIVLLIDALRYNFTARLPSLGASLHSSPDSSLLFPFIADAPTVTLQRLSALTTGSLPTFIDFASNFQSSAIAADNLIRQSRQGAGGARLSTAFMGDDTWTALFPDGFDLSFPYPSFNVKDLHTVDLGCIDRLLPTLWLLRRDAAQRSLVVSHFLGVDHVGHRYDAAHATMTDKLQQIDGVIADVIAFVDQQPPEHPTLLLVMGDHGMTDDGNHGGATPPETRSALFIHSSVPLIPASAASSTASLSLLASLFPASDPAAAMRRDVSQIDFVPSLSLALGLPIPFGSLGALIPELFVSPPFSAPALPHTLLSALYVNSYQVWRYLSVYQQTAGSFSSAALQELGAVFVNASETFARLLETEERDGSAARGPEQEAEAARLFLLYLAGSAAMCREKWATFNVEIMTAAIAVLATVVAMTAACLLSSQRCALSVPALVRPALLGAAVGSAGSLLTAAALPSISPLHHCVLLSCWASAAAVLWELLPSTRAAIAGCCNLRAVSLPSVVSGLSLLCYMQGLFTNSFIIHEPQVVFFLAMSVLLSAIPSSSSRFTSQALAVVALRLTQHVGDVVPSSTLSTAFFSPLQLVCIVGSVVALPVLLQRMAAPLARAGDYRLVYRLALPLSCLLCLLYWSLQSSSSSGSVSVPLLSAALTRLGLAGADGLLIRLGLPHAVYAIGYGGIAVLLYSGSQRRHPDPGSETASHSLSTKLESSATSATVSSSLHQRKTQARPLPAQLNGSDGVTVDHAVLDSGVQESGRSALSLAVLALLLPSFLLLLGPNSCPLLLLGLLVLHHHPFVPASLPHLTFLFFLSLSLFFSSSHSQSFSSLQVAAAFVGFDDFHVLPAGLMLAVNTFFHLVVLVLAAAACSSSASLAAVCLFSLRLCLTAVNALVNRRHLMVWEIFAPKFVFDGLSAVAVSALALLVEAAMSSRAAQAHRGRGAES